MSYRNDELIVWIRNEFNQDNEGFFRTEIYQYSETAQLSWYLTQAEKQRMRGAVVEDLLARGE